VGVVCKGGGGKRRLYRAIAATESPFARLPRSNRNLWLPALEIISTGLLDDFCDAWELALKG
jgi:hypothetical protein